MTTAAAEPIAVPAACGHTKNTGRIDWICTAPEGPPSWKPKGKHVHYYVRRFDWMREAEDAGIEWDGAM